MSFPNASSGATKKARPAGSRASPKRCRRRWQPHRTHQQNAGAGVRFQHGQRDPCNHVTIMTLSDAFPNGSNKDDRAMAPRPPVTKHPFTLMFVVIALMAPFAGLAWRTREWMGW